jgi:pilus assembly protein CpaB
MNRRLLTILLVAFVIAGLCALGVYKIVNSRITASKPVPTTRVVAAAEDIKLGAVLGPSDLTSVEFSGGSAPKGAILKPADVIGRGVISDIYQGEPILESRLAPKGSGGGLASTIPQGMRACAVKVDDVVGVAGFVTPGMRVDVLVSGNAPGAAATQGTMTKTILQNIEVLSAGTDIQKDAEGKPQQVQVVNLLVTPEQAQTLSLASSQLKIQLVLRNPLDTKITAVPNTVMSNLFANQGAAAAQSPQPAAGKKPARRPTYSIEVINGSKTTVEKFPTSEGQN